MDQQSPTVLAPGTGFMEDSFSAEVGGDGSGGNASDGEWPMKLHPLTHGSPPAVRPGS